MNEEEEYFGGLVDNFGNLKGPRSRNVRLMDSSLLNGSALSKTVSLPLLQIEEEVVRSSQHDIEWSFALREFNCFPEHIKDAIWALYKDGDQTILQATWNLMMKAITRQIMDSGIRPRANLNLVETSDFIILDQRCLEAPQKVAALLYEMRDERFKERDFEYAVRGESEPVKQRIKNQTWMTQSIVESVLLSMQHSHMRETLCVDEAAIGMLLKSGERVLPAVFDFFFERVRVEFDQRTLLAAHFDGEDVQLRGLFIQLYVDMPSFRGDEGAIGVPLRNIDFDAFRVFVKDCVKTDAKFLSVFYCYAFPEEAKKLHKYFLDTKQDSFFLEHGEPSVVSWIEAGIASKTADAESFTYYGIVGEKPKGEPERKQFRDQVLVLSDAYVNDNLPQLDEKDRLKGEFLPTNPYINELVELSQVDEEALRTLVDQSSVSGASILHGPLKKDLARICGRNRKVVSVSETKRCIRVMADDARPDAQTNELADMFPDAYAVFFNDFLVDNLINEPVGAKKDIHEYEVVATQPWMADCITARYRNVKITEVIGHTAEHTLSLYENGYADVLLLDLNEGIFSNADNGFGKFGKTWTSPCAVDQRKLVGMLERVLFQMGGPECQSKERLTAWIRIPLLIEPDAMILFYHILTSPAHRVVVSYPKKMHDTYLDVRIYPLEFKEASKEQLAKNKIVRTNRLVRYFFDMTDHFYSHLVMGIRERHLIWEAASGGEIHHWKSNRFKLFRDLNFSIELNLDRVKVIKKVVSHDFKLKRKADKGRIRAKKHKAAMEEFAKRTDKFLLQAVTKKVSGMVGK